MSNLVIVAIPAEDDYVNKISSEKVPHMTLLFLGDVEGKPVLKIAEFLEHAVSILELGPFGLEVDRRDTLGEDEADVLFFRRDPWNLKRIAEFRGQLLKNTPIKSAYESVEQFPEWQPHLTLGYPETPAKEDKRDYPGIHWVQFDRIALWYGDYEGPEFRLEYNYNYDLAEVAMSSTADAGKEFLEHYGVKGMKWGQRRAAAKTARAQRSHDRHERILARGEAHLARTDPSKPREVQVETVSGKGVLTSKAKIKTKGGEGHPPAPDAVKAAVVKQKLKKSGSHALSNQELADLATRLNLEQQVSRLTSGQRSSGERFVKDTLGNTGKQQIQRVANAQATKAVDRHGLTR